MRNPGEAAKPNVESETTVEECTKEADPCSSPPCKRLKQAVLPFQITTPQSTSSVFNAFDSPTNSSAGNNNIQTKQCQPKGEKCQINGGLVTGAPSPPNVKMASEQQQASRVPSDVVKPLILEAEGKEMPVNTQSDVSKTLPLEAKGMEMAMNRDTSSAPLLQSNSPSSDIDVMAIDQSPPAKTHGNQEPNCTPTGKSAEKRKRSKEEREKEKLERQKLREEKMKEKQESKAAKEKERLEAKRKRDEERQEKQAEKERKEKEKSEKREKEEKERLEKKEKREKEEKERQEKKEKRDEEKRKREEERNAKNEEKRKREEEKRSQEEEQARKRQKVKQSFASFFAKTANSTPKKKLPETCSRFRPFEIQQGMSLAPVTRKQSSAENIQLLDEGLTHQECDRLYLKELETRKPIFKYTKRRLSTIAEHEVKLECESETKEYGEVVLIDENSSSSIEIVEKKDDSKAGLRNKLIQFHTNHRPAYYGTWRKSSQYLSPKNPFKRDTDLFDYDVDSDDEWEEEEPGESLSNSEGEDEDGGGEDGDEDEDGFFVPHGYLSDDEGVEHEEIENDSTEKGDKDNESQNKQDQQLAKAKAWEASMKRKCKPLKPITVGCLWLEDAAMNITLKQFAACLLVDGPIETGNYVSKSNEATGELPSTPNNSGALYVPDEAMPDLIKLVHGNTAGLVKIMLQFRKQWTSKCQGREVTDDEVDKKSPISKRQIEKRIQLIATKERRTDRLRWYVHQHVLEKFALQHLQVPDGLNNMDASMESAAKLPVIPPSDTPSIMQFTRTVSPSNRGPSPEMKSPIVYTKQGDMPHESCPSPMEVDSPSIPSVVNMYTPTAKSKSPVLSNNATLNSFFKEKTMALQFSKLQPTPVVKTDGKTESNVSQAVPLPKGVETICID